MRQRKEKKVNGEEKQGYDGGEEDLDGAYTSSSVYVPLMNIPREDLRLRPEFVPALARAGINDVGELITVDDVPSTASMGVGE